MHEVSLCESIVKIVQKQAEKDGFSRVVSVTLSIGERSGASIEALDFCFPMVAKGTIAEGATLAFTRSEDDSLRVASLEVG
ncbi:MAG: hydrogenase maturation nickel metallochaperone HypA [Bdellovibrionales bacterium]|jgi:hydrogenase nickel incorporation protein HypA/HybF